MTVNQIVITAALLFIGGLCRGQGDSVNLNKYWAYRERLRNFIYVSPDFDEAGTNIPAERISEDSTTLAWDDGNGAFNHYLSVLATEYRLLKNAGKDYSQTTAHLYYALRSFERLDWVAESKYRADSSQQDGDLNGFFVRNDLDSGFWNKYKKGGTDEYFEQVNIVFGDRQQNSLDNCIHYLESFALINALVDNEYVDGTEINFRQLAKDNTRRIIGNMQQVDAPIPVVDIPGIDTPLADSLYSYTWYLKNPVTGEPIPDRYGSGLDGTMLYASYGFAQSANRILGTDEFGGMRFSRGINRVMLSNPITEIAIKLGVYLKTRLLPLPVKRYADLELSIVSPDWEIVLFDLYKDPEPIKILIFPPDTYIYIPTYITRFSRSKTWGTGWDDYKVRSLCATGNIDIVAGRSPYEVLVKKQRESSVFKYEHLPLIWSVVTNNFDEISEADLQYLRNLLDVAPPEGPYKFLRDGVIEYAQYEWSYATRLVWPEKLGGYSFNGYYNGLDYMLLHNLYTLARLSRPGLVEMTHDEGMETLADKKPKLPTNEASEKFEYIKSITSQPLGDALLVYPNPFQDVLHVDNRSLRELSRMELYTATGGRIEEVLSPPSPSIYLPPRELPEGIYFLKVIASDGEFSYFKVLKE